MNVNSMNVNSNNAHNPPVPSLTANMAIACCLSRKHGCFKEGRPFANKMIRTALPYCNRSDDMMFCHKHGWL